MPSCAGNTCRVAVLLGKEFNLDNTEGALEITVPLEKYRSKVVIMDSGKVGTKNDRDRVLLDDAFPEVCFILIFVIGWANGADDFSRLFEGDPTGGV